MKKLVILDLNSVTISIFSIDWIFYTEDGDFNIVETLDFIESTYGVHFKESEIEWMLADEKLSVTIY